MILISVNGERVKLSKTFVPLKKHTVYLFTGSTIRTIKRTVDSVYNSEVIWPTISNIDDFRHINKMARVNKIKKKLQK